MIPIENIQPIEKLSLGDGQSLSVHSIFYTIQGEGPYAGWPAVFIRLAGCNLQCVGCDTDYTSTRKIMPVEDIAIEAYRAIDPDHNYHMPIAVITGGEPFRQNITLLCEALHNIHNGLAFKVQVETNGTLPPSPNLSKDVVIVCSPKTPKINPLLAQRANFFKYVLSHNQIDKKDGLPHHVLDTHTAGGKVARPPQEYNGPIYLQPMDTTDGLVAMDNPFFDLSPEQEKLKEEYLKNVSAVVKSCKTFGHIVQLQTHKLLGVQ